jgi:ABC-type sugar transport system permease subunit
LSIYLVKIAVLQFDLGPGGAFSLIYFVIVLLFSFILLSGPAKNREGGQGMKGKKKYVGLTFTFHPVDGSHLLDAQYVPEVQCGHSGVLRAVSEKHHLHELHEYLHRFLLVHGYVNSMIYVASIRPFLFLWHCPRPTPFHVISLWATSRCFSGCSPTAWRRRLFLRCPFFSCTPPFGLMDTHIAVALAHCLFNVPLAVWILEGFMSGIPREIDETAFIDGYSFPRFFITIFIPLIRAGVGVTAFFCFMFSWVELLLARTLTVTEAKPISAIMTRTISATGLISGCWPPPAS